MNIWVVKRGKAAAMADRTMVLAAKAEALYCLMQVQLDINEVEGGLTDRYQPKSSIKGRWSVSDEQVEKVGRKLTRKDTKIKAIAAPITIVLRPGTYQGTAAYCPVQPSQKMPITKSELPSMAP